MFDTNVAKNIDIVVMLHKEIDGRFKKKLATFF